MLLVHLDGHLVDGGHVDRLEHGVGRHVAEQCNLAAHFVGYGVFGAEHQHIGLYAQLLELLHGVLGGFGFQLLCRCDVGHIGEVDAKRVLTQLPAELTHGFEERERLDVAHDTTDFGDHEVEIAGEAELLHGALDFVGDMGYDLHRLAEVVAAALLVDDALIDAACSDIVGPRSLDIGESLVVTEVEVGLMAVDSDIALAMFVGIQSAGVDVDVRVEFLNCHPVTPRFQQTGKRRRDDSLSERGNHTAGNKNIFSFH